MIKTQFGFDKHYVSPQIIKEFDLAPPDIIYNEKEHHYNFNFVGILVHNNNNLIILPCGYASSSEEIMKKDIKLLFQTIHKYMATTSKAESYYGDEYFYQSNFPFEDFLNIYEYYLKYGFYKYEKYKMTDGYGGNISWKQTIEQAKIVINNGNILYIPFKVKKRNDIYGFVSECMSFIINYTISNFEGFIHLQKVRDLNNTFDYISNREHVVNKLNLFSNELKKDHEKKLVHHIIAFFENLDDLNRNGGLHIKIRYFNYIWQNMVEKYLNSYFVDVESDSLKISKKILAKQNNFKNNEYKVDNSKNNFSIHPDHIYLNEEKRKLFLLDSKYYKKIKKLDYKQFTYFQLVKNIYIQKNIEVVSAIILPGTALNIHKHLEIKDEYLGKDKQFIIYEIYISIKEVMEKYLES